MSAGRGGVERYLEAREPVVYRTRLHPVTLGWTVAFAVFVLGVVALIVERNVLAPSTIAILWTSGAALALGSSVLPWLRWRASELAVTPRRLLAQVGLRTVHAVDLNGLDRVEVEARPWARLLGYGTVRLRGRDAELAVFAGVRDQAALREALLRQARAGGRRKA